VLICLSLLSADLPQLFFGVVDDRHLSSSEQQSVLNVINNRPEAYSRPLIRRSVQMASHNSEISRDSPAGF
jgi:hypothetical protein